MKPVNCICGEPHLCLDIFKENGVWVCMCDSCDRLVYSHGNKKTVIEKWNEMISKEKNSIGSTDSIGTDIQRGVMLLAYNIIANWKNEYQKPMSDDMINDIVGLFAETLDETNKEL